MSEMEKQVNETSPNNLPTAKQASIDQTESAINILESQKQILAILYNGRQYQKAHHRKVLTWIQTCKMINYKR